MVGIINYKVVKNVIIFWCLIFLLYFVVYFCIKGVVIKWLLSVDGFLWKLRCM